MVLILKITYLNLKEEMRGLKTMFYSTERERYKHFIGTEPIHRNGEDDPNLR